MGWYEARLPSGPFWFSSGWTPEKPKAGAFSDAVDLNAPSLDFPPHPNAAGVPLTRAECTKRFATITHIFAKRLNGLELDLCDLTAEEARCIKNMHLVEWAAVQRWASADDSAGIAYIELGAELLPDLIPGLQQLSVLECVSVWAPIEGGAIDFGILSGGDKPLRINILGTPSKPLAITVYGDAKVEAKETSSSAIRRSLVHRTDDFGRACSHEPLYAAQPVLWGGKGQAQRSPCQDDPVLLETLVRLLDRIAPSLPSAVRVADSTAVAKALLGCGRFNSVGDFGFDLTALDQHHVDRIRALPPQAWAALQRGAERAGEDVSWLNLADGMPVDARMVASLQKLSPLLSLSLKMPLGATSLDVGQLQGPGLRLRDLNIRSASSAGLTFKVPAGVKVTVLPTGGRFIPPPFTVRYEDASGNVAHEDILSV